MHLKLHTSKSMDLVDTRIKILLKHANYKTNLIKVITLIKIADTF